MNPTTLLAWSWLNVLTKKRYDAIIQVYTDLEEALTHVDANFLQQLGCREDTIEKALVRLDEFDPDAYQAALAKRGLTLIHLDDPAYPAKLKEIGDPPVFLYYKGNIDILNQPSIGLVGRREMSTYGKRVTESFVAPIVQAGLVTISGLALGIDAAVAQETLHAGGQTVAVLGHGLGKIYPSANAKLAEEIVDKGGLLLSEFPLDVPPDKYTFPARNRIVAGLSQGTVVLEAGEGSGALITADLALDYGREVFAVPGQVFDENYVGCHQLIAQGRAKLVTSPQDVLQELGVIVSDTPTPRSYEPQTDQESQIYAVLTSMPQTVSDLLEKTRLETGDINASLTMMELAGAVKNVGGGEWVKL